MPLPARILLWLLPAVALLLLALSGNLMSQVEQPKYQVLETHGPIEIRQYPPLIVAEVDVQGSRMHALNQGFRLIANYIFGHNLSAQKVPMTAPVTQQPGEKIPMTAPVTQTGTGESWKVQFIMPSAYTLATLPQPQNPAVHLRTLPARKTAAIRFSGSNTEKNLATHRATLLHYRATFSATIYYTPEESGFPTAVMVGNGAHVTIGSANVVLSGFAPGETHNQTFIESAGQEGCGQTSDGGYIAYNGSGNFSGISAPVGSHGNTLTPKQSMAVSSGDFASGWDAQTLDSSISSAFGTSSWTADDVGGAIGSHHIDLYWGVDNPASNWGHPAGTSYTGSSTQVVLNDEG